MYPAAMISCAKCLLTVIMIATISIISGPIQATSPVTPLCKASIDALLGEAQDLLQQQEFQAAIEVYRKVLSFYQKEQNDQRVGEIMVMIGPLYSAVGNDERALQHFEQAIEIFQRIANQKDEAMTLIYLGNTQAEWSRYEDAFETLQRALRISRTINDPAGEWSALKSSGDVLLKLGRFEEALDSYFEALQISETAQQCRSHLTLIASIGSAYTASGQYRQAILQSEQALALLQKAPCNDLQNNVRERQVLHAEILLILGTAYLRIGDYARAQARLEEALAVFRDTRNTWREAATLTRLGGIYEEQGDYFSALNLYEQALAIQRTRPDIIDHMIALNNTAKAWFRFCQTTSCQQEAIPLYEEALKVTRANGAQMGEARILNNLGEVYLELSRTTNAPDRLTQALDCFQQALHIQRDLSDHTNAWITLANLGHLYERQKAIQEALDCYQEAIAMLEEITTFSRIEELTINLRAQAAEVYQRAIILLVRLGEHEAAFHLSERARARAFLDQLGNTRITFHNTTDSHEILREQQIRTELVEIEHQLDREFQKPSDAQSPQRIRFLKAQRAEKRQAYADLRLCLQAAHPEYHRLTTIEPLTLAQIQQFLTPKITLLSYVVAQESTVAFMITHNTLHAFLLPVGEQELTVLVQAVRQPAELHQLPSPAFHTLYQHLIAPLASHLNTPLLGIIPHGVLHYLPFAALRDSQGQYLNDIQTLFLLPGATGFAFLKKDTNYARQNVLALANSRAAGLPSLFFADQEVQALATFYARYYSVLPLFGSQNHSLPASPARNSRSFSAATETAFKTLAPSYAIVHLAAHGELNAVNPLFSRIRLVADEQNDGALEVHELYELNLEHTDLVVLSACDTQLGRLSRGDDLIGLTRAFMYAGVPSVMASLWKVDDQATRDLMVAFYFFLKHSATTADALRAAQRLTRARYPHPYYWAAFVLTGDPGIV